MNTLRWEELFPNLFLVRDDEIGVIYAPLLGKFFSVEKESLEIIDNFVGKGKPTNDEFYSFLAENGFFQEVQLPRESKRRKFNSKELTVSVTSACNLRCIYCYARGGTSFINLPWYAIVISINQMFYFAKKRRDKQVEMSFHGTGESTVKWQTLVDAVNYALSLLPRGWEIRFSLVTNGTLLDEEKAKFLSAHKFSVVLSIDGLEEVQNFLRPKADGTGSFDAAIEGAKILVKYKIPFAMRSTITGINQDDILRFLELCASIGCTEISVAPFSLTGRGKEGVPDIDAARFIRLYILTKMRAKELGVSFSMPSDYLDNVSARYCNADGESMAVMPEGLVSSCTRVTRSDDPLAETFFIGKIDSTGVIIDNQKVQNLRGLNLYHFQECQGCFAKFTCAGGCHHTRMINGGTQPQNYCQIMQGVLWNTLKEAATE